MQIKYKASGEAAHVQNDIGRALIATGLAAEIPSAIPKPFPDLQWAVREGAGTIDFQNPPYIFFNCGGCKTKGCVENPSKSYVVHHCGLAEEIPSQIRKEYDDLMAAYRKRSRKQPKERISRAVESPAPLHNAGLKTSAELQSDLRQQMAEAALRK